MSGQAPAIEVLDSFEVIDLLTGYRPAMVIMSAERLGVFGALGSEPHSAGELAGRLDASGGSGSMFDVMMRMENGAAADPLESLTSILESAGFEELTVVDLPEPLAGLKGVR